MLFSPLSNLLCPSLSSPFIIQLPFTSPPPPSSSSSPPTSPPPSHPFPSPPFLSSLFSRFSISPSPLIPLFLCLSPHLHTSHIPKGGYIEGHQSKVCSGYLGGGGGGLYREGKGSRPPPPKQQQQAAMCMACMACRGKHTSLSHRPFPSR